MFKAYYAQANNNRFKLLKKTFRCSWPSRNQYLEQRKAEFKY